MRLEYWDISQAQTLYVEAIEQGALSGDALARRGININTECKQCGEKETEIHAFFQCPPYALIMPALHKPAAATATIHQILEGSKRIINLPPSGIYQPLHPWILWNLWTRRNQILFENKKYSKVEVINKAIKDTREWSQAQNLSPSKVPRCFHP